MFIEHMNRHAAGGLAEVFDAWLFSGPLPEGSLVLVNLSGRGDKDLETVRAAFGSVPGVPDA